VLPEIPPATPDQAFEDKERREIVRSAIAELPDKQRIALILNKYERFTAREISEILRIPLTAVEARLRRAKSRLKKKLLAYLKGDRS
jgi:RNA polymerase sigma-70 factor (ECF subfamily)